MLHQCIYRYQQGWRLPDKAEDDGEGRLLHYKPTIIGVNKFTFRYSSHLIIPPKNKKQLTLPNKTKSYPIFFSYFFWLVSKKEVENDLSKQYKIEQNGVGFL